MKRASRTVRRGGGILLNTLFSLAFVSLLLCKGFDLIVFNAKASKLAKDKLRASRICANFLSNVEQGNLPIDSDTNEPRYEEFFAQSYGKTLQSLNGRIKIERWSRVGGNFLVLRLLQGERTLAEMELLLRDEEDGR